MFRLPRFRLRRLFVLVFAASLPIAGLSHRVRLEREIDAACRLGYVSYAEFLPSGGLRHDLPRLFAELLFPQRLQSVVSISTNDLLNDASLQRLLVFPHVGLLSTGRSPLTDDGIPLIARMTELTRLSINSPRVTDAGIRSLTGLSHLTALDLSDTGLTDAGMPAIAGFQELEALCLNRTAVTDTGLAQIEALPSLRYLSLEGTSVSNRAVVSLQTLPSLETLCVHGTRFTKPGAAELRERTGHPIAMITPCDLH